MPDPTPTDLLQQRTQTSFVTLNLITQACHGILNTTFTPPADKKPDWFDDLKGKLDAAKVVAQNWIDNIAPDVTGGVPLQVIDYGATFSAVAGQIQAIVAAHPDAQGADDPYVKQVHQLVSVLVDEVSGMITKADATATSLKTWGDKMQTAHDQLSTGAVNIQKAESDLQTDVDKMNTAITTLQKMIHDENIAIAVSAGGIGVGLLLLVVGIALAPETGGGTLVLAGTGGLLIIGGTVTWAVMQDKINKQFKEIAGDQAELDSDKRQLVALKGLDTASSQAINYTTSATSSLSDFRTSWTVFEGELKGVLSNLEKAESALSTLLEGTFTQAAVTEWATATAFAQSLADAPVQVPVKELPMQGSLAAADAA